MHRHRRLIDGCPLQSLERRLCELSFVGLPVSSPVRLSGYSPARHSFVPIARYDYCAPNWSYNRLSLVPFLYSFILRFVGTLVFPTTSCPAPYPGPKHLDRALAVRSETRPAAERIPGE